MASHTFKECNYHNAILKLTNNCGADGKRHGMLSATEVAALIVNGTLEKIDGMPLFSTNKSSKHR